MFLIGLFLIGLGGCMLSAHAQTSRVTDSSKFRAQEYMVYQGTFSRRWHNLNETYYTSLAKIKAAKAAKGINTLAHAVQSIRYRVQEGVYDATNRPIWTCPKDDGVCTASAATEKAIPPPTDQIKTLRALLPDKKVILTFQQYDMASPDVCTQNNGEGGSYVPETEQPGHCNDVETHNAQQYKLLNTDIEIIAGTDIYAGDMKSHLTIAE